MYRLGAAVVGAAVSAPLLMGASPVQAADDTPAQTKLKIRELPLYEKPPMQEYEYVPFEEVVLMKPPYDAITVARQNVAQVCYVIRDKKNAVFGKIEENVPQVTDFIRYVQDESNVVAKAVVISSAGLAGLGLGSLTGLFSKKLVYTMVGMGSATSICYPKQTIEFVRNAWNTDIEFPYHYAPGEKTSSESSSPAAAEAVSEAEPVESTTAQSSTESSQKVIDPEKVDHGMSKADDQDMYTTRE